MAIGASTSRSRSIGNETTLMLRATTAKTKPINFHPCDVPKISPMNRVKDLGGMDPKSDT